MENETGEVEVLVDEEQAADEAMSAMTAGYNKQRHIDEPAEPVVEAVEAVEAVEPAEPAPPTVNETIDALKAQVSELNGTPASIRKIYGELGNIQRALKQQQSQPTARGEPSPEMLAAIAQADDVAKEYPELAGPLVNLAKLISKQAAPQAASSPAIDVESAIREGIARERQTDAIEALHLEHPDYTVVRGTPEYKEWLAAKDAAFRETFTTTWNAGFVAKGLTAFKTWREAKAQAADVKQKRLASAVTRKGVGPSTGSTKLPDSAGLAAGYNKVRRLNIAATR